jgi:hypothetical protein
MRTTILTTAVLAMIGSIANAQGLKDVYKDYFKIFISLIYNALNASVKILFNFVNRDNYRY